MTKRSRGLKSPSTAGIVLVATVAILAAGCSNAGSGTTTTTTTTTTAPSTTSTTAASTTSTTAASTTSTTAASTTSTVPGGKSGSTLLNLFKSGEHVTFTATYKVTGTSGSLSSLTLAQESPNLLFKGATSSGTFELVTLGAKSYICSQTAGAWTCFTLGSGTSIPEADLFALYEPKTYLPEFQAAASAAGGHATYSTKTVNGYSLSCLSVSGVTRRERERDLLCDRSGRPRLRLLDRRQGI